MPSNGPSTGVWAEAGLNFRVESGVAWLVLNRPHRRNAVDHQLRLALLAAIDEVRDDPSIRAALLTGSGTALPAPGRGPTTATSEGRPGAAQSVGRTSSLPLVRRPARSSYAVAASARGYPPPMRTERAGAARRAAPAGSRGASQRGCLSPPTTGATGRRGRSSVRRVKRGP